MFSYTIKAKKLAVGVGCFAVALLACAGGFRFYQDHRDALQTEAVPPAAQAPVQTPGQQAGEQAEQPAEEAAPQDEQAQAEVASQQGDAVEQTGELQAAVQAESQLKAEAAEQSQATQPTEEAQSATAKKQDQLPREIDTRAEKLSLKGETAKQRSTFLKAVGIAVESEPLEVLQVRLPSDFDERYTQYNDLQKKSGMDLAKYKGKSVKRYRYLKKAADGEGETYVHLLVYKGNIVGGDITPAAQDTASSPLFVKKK